MMQSLCPKEYPKSRYVHGAVLGKWDDTIASKIVKSMIDHAVYQHKRRQDAISYLPTFKSAQSRAIKVLFARAKRPTGSRAYWDVLAIEPVEGKDGVIRLGITWFSARQGRIVPPFVVSVFTRHALARILQRKTHRADPAALWDDVSSLARAVVHFLISVLHARNEKITDYQGREFVMNCEQGQLACVIDKDNPEIIVKTFIAAKDFPTEPITAHILERH
jgi:hypothetical protein